MAHAQLGDISQAIEDYKRAIAYDPQDVVSRFNLANAYRKQNLIDEAIAEYDQCINRRPDLSGPYNNLAALLTEKKQDLDRAIELATEACSLTRWQDWNTIDTLASAYAAKGRFAEAAKYQGQAATVAPSSENLRLRRRQEIYAAQAKKNS